MPRTARAPAASPPGPARAVRRTPAAPIPGGPWAPLALLTLAATAEVFRLGFFADDFYFLDVARRAPILARLLGQYSIHPWYRPLSREVFFSLLAAAGPLGSHLAHAVSVAALLASALALWKIAGHLLDRRSGAVACAILITCSDSKFLVSWASGFQDLLAVALVLWAFWGYLARRPGVMLACAALAPLAKETGFLVLPLVLCYAVVCEGERRPRRWMMHLLLVTLAAAAAQAAVRATWPHGGAVARVSPLHPPGVAPLLGVLRGMLPDRPAPGLLPALLAGLAAAAALILFRGARDGDAPPRARNQALFLGLAFALGITPMLVVSLARVSQPYPYYAFPAVPWLALLLARAARPLAARAVSVALALWVAASVWGLGFPAIDLDRDSGWQHRGWDWYDACRLSEVAHRFGVDLREGLAARAESTIVLYTDLPTGSWFQTDDGPATREALHDPTVQAFFISDAPLQRPNDRFAIVYFDLKRYHLRLAPRDAGASGTRAAMALAFGHGPAAFVWASYCPPGDRGRFDIAYPRAAAALMNQGVAGFQRELAAAGLGDSLGPAPRTMARTYFPDEPGLGAAYANVLEHPLTSAAHAVWAESLEARQSTIAAIVEYRICEWLTPDRPEERLRLAAAIGRLGAYEEARDELRQVLALGAPAALERRAREDLARLDSLESAPPHGGP